MPEPVYIGPESLTSVALGDVVMGIQNSQTNIPCGLQCDGEFMQNRGRNPGSSLLVNIAAAIGGLSSHSVRMADTKAFMGSSALFSAPGNDRSILSALDLVINFLEHIVFVTN